MTKKYLLSYSYVPDVLEKRAPFREKHLELAQKLVDQGRCEAGGATALVGEEAPTGALFVFSDLEAAKELVQGDPYVSNGIVVSHTIQEWTVAVEKKS